MPIVTKDTNNQPARPPYGTSENLDGSIGIYDATTNTIALVYNHYNRPGEAIHTARLMAAAPKLESALARLHDAALMVEILVSAYANKGTASELSAALQKAREVLDEAGHVPPHKRNP